MALFKRSKFAGFIGEKSKVPDGVWAKCSACHKPVYQNELDENRQVCPVCNFHFRIPSNERIDLLVDPGSFVVTHSNIESADTL